MSATKNGGALGGLAEQVQAAEAAVAREVAAHAAAVRAVNAAIAREAAAEEGSFEALLDQDFVARRRAVLAEAAEKACLKMTLAKGHRDAQVKAVADARALIVRARQFGLDTAEAQAEISALDKGLGTCRANLGRARSEAERALRALEAIGGTLAEGSEAAKVAAELKARGKAEAQARAKAKAQAEAAAARARALKALDAPSPQLGERIGREAAAALEALRA